VGAKAVVTGNSSSYLFAERRSGAVR